MHSNVFHLRQSLTALSGILFLGLATIGSSANAAALRCDNCSEAGYEAKAMTRTFGSHHVYDLVKGNVRKYEIFRSCEPGDGCWTEAEPMPVEGDVNAIVIELAALHAVTQGTMKSHFTVHTNGPVGDMSAYNVILPGGSRNTLMHWMTNINRSWQNGGIAAHGLAGAAANIFSGANVTTLVTVVFADGSSAVFSYDAINNSAGYVEGSATDKYGNIIPANVNQLNGIEFNYSAEGSNGNGPAGLRMQNHLSTMFGVVVVYGNSSRITSWTCTATSSGVSCRGH